MKKGEWSKSIVIALLFMMILMDYLRKVVIQMMEVTQIEYTGDAV